LQRSARIACILEQSPARVPRCRDVAECHPKLASSFA